MNLHMDISEATYSRSGEKFSILYTPSVVAGMVRYCAKCQYAPQSFKLFTFSWGVGRKFINLARRVGQ